MLSKITTLPGCEPVSVSEIEEWTQIGTVPDDQIGVVARAITTAREMLEHKTDRQLITAKATFYLDQWPNQIELRRHLPITAIDSVSYVDTDGDTQTLTVTTDYLANVADPDRPALIMPGRGATWPSLRTEVYNPITIVASCGYGTSPESVPMAARQWIAMLVATWYYQARESTTPATINDVPRTLFDGLLDSLYWGAYA